MLRSNTTRIELTTDLAAFWLSHFAYEANRKVTDAHVERMIRVHLRDQFPETEAVHCTVRGSDNRNLDSQHRCEMVIRTGKPLPLNLKQFDAPDSHERHMLWKSIDRGRPRTYLNTITGDWRGAGFQSIADMRLISSTMEIVEGHFTAASANQRNMSSFEERSEFAFHRSQTAQIIFDAMKEAPSIYSALVRRKLVIAVLLPLCDPSAAPEKISELVRMVSNNEGLMPKSAAHRLLTELHGQQGKDLQGKAAVEFMRRIAFCCIRHIEGKQCAVVPAGVSVMLPGSGIVIG